MFSKCKFPLCPRRGKYHVGVNGTTEDVCWKHLSLAVCEGLDDAAWVVVDAA